MKAWEKKTTKGRSTNGNRAILRSISNIIKERKEKGIKIPEIIWTPSHMGEKGKVLTKTMKEQIENLKEIFNISAIKKGNSKADELAKEGADKDTGERRIWNTVDKYYLRDRDQVEEREVNEIITKIYRRRIRDKVGNNSGYIYDNV